MADFKVNDTGEIEVTNSCGCTFCDLGDTPKMFQGEPSHIQANCDVFPCTRGANAFGPIFLTPREIYVLGQMVTSITFLGDDSISSKEVDALAKKLGVPQ